MLTFKRKQTQEEKDKRAARYAAMSEESLRAQIDRFSEELKEKRMGIWECHLKTNSLRYAMMELNRRGLSVAPVIIAIQKKRTTERQSFFITMEMDAKKLERNISKLLL